jgi:orotidine-5'-phosphate decarboxylase
VQRQYHGGALRISEFAHVANISILSGDDVVSALAQVVSAHEFPYKGQRAFLLLAEMTSRGSLARGQYTRRCVELAREHGDVVIGFVATTALGSGSERQEREAESKAEAEGGGQEDFLVFSTGINQSSKGDALGQQYQTPTKAVEGGTDFIIVGRGIYAADDPVAAAKSYQREGWEAYLKRVGEL